MCSTQRKVLIIGPGFIGLNVLDILVKENYKVTGLVRRQDHAAQIQSSGARTVVVGDLHDHDLIAQQTFEHGVVIHTATADDLPSVEAVLDGVRRCADAGLSTIYIRTTSTSSLDDGSHGAFKSEHIYRDDAAGGAAIDAPPDTALHRAVERAIVAAQAALGPRAKLAIMVPPLVYGVNAAHYHSHGADADGARPRLLSIQVPALTRFALKHGWTGHVGDGCAVASDVHVLDLARPYRMLLHHLEHTPADALLADPGHPYWFYEATGDGEPSWRDVAATIGACLHAAGRIPDNVPHTVDPALYGDLFGDATPAAVGLNSRSRAVRLRALGWRPVENSWMVSFVQDELPEILNEGDFENYKGYQGRFI
jgi:nucleoside-diphosphate-sugar epimerase